MTVLAVGDLIPDFTLKNQFGENVTSSGLRGSRVLLVFYPFAFSPTCGSEWRQLKDRAVEFTAANVRVFGISVDSKYGLRAYAEAEELPFELLSDFWPHGEISRVFGVFNEQRGMSERGTFAVDGAGILQASFSGPSDSARPWQKYQEALHALSAS